MAGKLNKQVDWNLVNAMLDELEDCANRIANLCRRMESKFNQQRGTK